MSKISASDVSQKISAMDSAIREGLILGNIADVMRQNKSKLGCIFKTCRSLVDLPNAVAEAYSTRVFLWPFCLAWTKAGLLADNKFITEQLQAMTAFDRTSQKVQHPETVPETQPSAIASSLALPTQPKPALQTQPNSALIIHVKWTAAPPKPVEESEEEISEEGEGEGILKEAAGHRSWPKPMQGDREMDPPCLHCVGKGITCWMQVWGTKACYDCGRQKLGDVEIVEAQPRPKPKPKSKPRPRTPSSSPMPRFSAIDKGKGRADCVDNLEDIVEGLQELVTGLLVGNVNLQSQMMGEMAKKIVKLEKELERQRNELLRLGPALALALATYH
ncbi:hypothetical protein BYT27DRAFT_7217438 [Phlegmacium glaucopus]|nr:hypothetical protein BYT27DRAFT_7217438 [Phlegmacium glaucopus]